MTSAPAPSTRLPTALRARLAELLPGARVLGARALGDDAHPAGETAKELGYGHPIRVELEGADGARHDLVLHVLRADPYGHDRRADRVAEVVLASDTVGRVPGHVRVLDAGVLGGDPSAALVSLLGTGEPYLLTAWAEGDLYADDLRRIAASGALEARDVARGDRLADYLAELHAAPGVGGSVAYDRALRDLVGAGEGIAGIADGYEAATAGAPRARIEAIEHACLRWRHRLRARTQRLRRTHGDFHPFNLLFSGHDALTPLDASRGCAGDPADDVAALTVNHLFFGMEHRALWRGGLGVLWERFWPRYLGATGDHELLEVIAPFFAWRGLVVASPRWYPHLSANDRDRILAFVERVLGAERFEPAWGAEAMA